MTQLIAAAMIVLAACGRIGFDAVAGSSDAVDGTRSDVSGGDGSVTTSCAGLGATCGPMGNGACCDGPVVTGGTFYRSYDVATDAMFPDSDACR